MASMVHEVSQESYENKKASFRKTHPNEENKNEHKIWKKSDNWECKKHTNKGYKDHMPKNMQANNKYILKHTISRKPVTAVE